MHKLIFNLLIIFFTASLISAPKPSINQTSKQTAKQTAKPADDFSEFINHLEEEKFLLQGGAVAILKNGKVIYKKTFGHVQGKNSPPITSSTLFPLASVSKPVSATAVALLVDNGTLNLNERYKFPYLENSVSLKNILSHTTGYKFSGNLEIEHGITRNKILQTLKNHTPDCNPGECYYYSNTTYSLVEEALNKKDLSLQDAIQNMRRVLKTDGIQIMPINTVGSIAYPHVVGKNKKKVQVRVTLPFPPYYPKAAPAAAGVFASLDGMIEIFKLNFGYRPDLISQKTLDIFHTPVIANRDIFRWHAKWPMTLSKIESYYGIGWRILKSKLYPNRDLIFHSGSIKGIRTFIGYIPAKKTGIIILVNQNSDFTFRHGIGFWGRYLNKTQEKLSSFLINLDDVREEV